VPMSADGARAGGRGTGGEEAHAGDCPPIDSSARAGGENGLAQNITGGVRRGVHTGSSYLAPVVSARNRRSQGFLGGPAHIFIRFAEYVALIWII
jgi:hypothetical protein